MVCVCVSVEGGGGSGSRNPNEQGGQEAGEERVEGGKQGF